CGARNGTVRLEVCALPEGAAGPDRSMAGFRAQQHHLRPTRAVRRVLRPQLVGMAGPLHSWPDRKSHSDWRRSVLSRVMPAAWAGIARVTSRVPPGPAAPSSGRPAILEPALLLF